jgi:hypothetical protein
MSKPILEFNAKYKKGVFANTEDIYNLFKNYRDRITVELKEKGVYNDNTERLVIEIKVKPKPENNSDTKPDVKPKIKSECPKSPNGKHEYILAPDSFDLPFCKHCYKSN